MSRKQGRHYGTALGGVEKHFAPAFVLRAQGLINHESADPHTSTKPDTTTGQQGLFTLACFMFCALPSLASLLIGLNRSDVAYQHAIANNSTATQAGDAADKAFYPFLIPVFTVALIAVSAICLDRQFKLTEKAGSVLSSLFCCGKRDQQRQRGEGVALVDSRGWATPSQA